MKRRIKKLLKSATLLLVAGVMAFQYVQPLAAESPPLPDLIDNGIDYYIPGDVCGTEGDPSAIGGPGSLEGHTLPAAKGGTGFEEAINENGQIPGKGFVTFSQNVRNAPTTPIAGDPEGRSLQDLYRQYYITMRWRYVKWNWDGGGVSPGPESVDFYSKTPRVLVTNPRTGKSIIAAVLEAGPAPWTGVDGSSNNTPKQGWVNPQDGTPATYHGRVSGFPPRAIADLGATMRMRGDPNIGDELIYQWAPDQTANPGPVSGTVQLPPGTDPNAVCADAGGAGDVNADGFSFPVADQRKHGYGTLPCTRYACHHDGTPAFDLMYGPQGNMDGKAVYAITAGTIQTQRIYHGVPQCYSIQFKSDLGLNGDPKKPYFYWYGHLQNPKFEPGRHVDAGVQIAEVARNSLKSDCRGGRDHLHIDRGCIRGGIPKTGGGPSCRDPAFVPILQGMWEKLPPVGAGGPSPL
jgi:hypothetical protein